MEAFPEPGSGAILPANSDNFLCALSNLSFKAIESGGRREGPQGTRRWGFPGSLNQAREPSKS